MARDRLKNYEDLDLKDAKNDDRLTKVYRDWAKKYDCLLYTSPSPRDPKSSRMPSSA